jgi:tetratricopeptide (TPR) repeat protein
VLVRRDGQVKLLDFGIAKLLAGDSASEDTTLITIGGVRPMTPGYAAPEQLQGKPITTVTDVYALGVLLYDLLTGRHPMGDSIHAPAELVRAVVEQEPLRPSVVVDPVGGGQEVVLRAAYRASTPEKLRRSLRGDLDTIILKALKKDPAERYTSVAALSDDLQNYLRNQPIRARPDAITYRAAKFARRNAVAVALAGLTVVASLTGAITTFSQARTARRQRDFALRQLLRAERVTGLNELLLSEVAPSGGPITKHELLEREERIVEREQYDNAADHAELLISIGAQYSGEEENERARHLLNQAYQLSRGAPDLATRAKASCELGWSLIPSGELARAEELFQSGLRQLPAEPQFDPVRVLCLIDGAEIAYRNGSAREALARTETAERTFKHSPVQSPVEELNVLIALADAYGTTGKFRESDAAFRRAAARMSSLGYDDTQKAVKLFNDWGLMLSDAGRPLQAADVYRRAIEIDRTNQTEDEVLPTILHNYSGVLRDLGKLREAEDYAERAHQKALLVGNQILANQSDLQRARIYRDEHQYDRAAAILAELEPKLRSSLPPGHYAFAVFQSDKSLLAEAQGNLPLALQLGNAAVETDQAAIDAGGQGATYLPSFLVRRSNLELETGRVDEAVADSSKAVQLLKSQMEPGTLSSSLGRAYLALARALAAQGKRADSREVSRVALENLQPSVGPSHPDTLRAKRLLG